MNTLDVLIVNKSPHALPAYRTAGAAGMDIQVWLSGKEEVLQPMERKLLSTGLFIQLPRGYEAQIRPRSGTSFKKGISLVNTPGTIDSDYRGEVMLPIINLSNTPQAIICGERIAQMIIAPVVQASWQVVTSLEKTERQDGGFGHTGEK